MALKVVVQRGRGGEWARRQAGKRDHSCKLDSNKAPLMSPLGNWRERERESKRERSVQCPPAGWIDVDFQSRWKCISRMGKLKVHYLVITIT